MDRDRDFLLYSCVLRGCFRGIFGLYFMFLQTVSQTVITALIVMLNSSCVVLKMRSIALLQAAR